MTFDLIHDLPGKFKVKGRGTGYRPENTSAGVQNWSETIASLAEKLTRP